MCYVTAVRMNVFVFLLLIVKILCVTGKYNWDYKGYKVYNVDLKTEGQEKQFHLLKSDAVDYWRKPSVKHGVVGQAMVPPSHEEWFEDQLELLGVEKDIAIEDVYDYLEEKDSNVVRIARNDADGGASDDIGPEDEDIEGSGEQDIGSEENGSEDDDDESVDDFDFMDYYRYDKILAHLYRLQESYTNSTTSLEVIEFGRTEENRPLVYLKLTNMNNQTDIQKPVIVVEAGIIPREWITIPASLYVVKKVLNETTFLDDFEWVIIPVLNPDGYEYTHTNLRFWTKSRSTNSNLGFICPGVNINRNFDIDWLNFDSSSSACSHLFAGVSPFSEIESQLVRSIIEEFGSRLRMYISLQNTGGFISYPWHYERAASGMFRQHLLLGRDMVAAMDEDYSLDISAEASGDRVSGTSTDYARNATVLYTFNVDVVPRGTDAVLVPKEEIVDIAEDVWRAVSVAANGVL
ncbi:carboxypeptidase B-like [Ostrinia furnacalis]|uniref:carboxypeptidase B-like n=1 Tax=Ostrinia furnacalis TaxID=93504 RepID=UPI001040D704|nr:carboxypeptidase B-like [Ostrinia furnacalis]